jgi:hypothetical protein
LKKFNQEISSVILSNPMAGAKYFIPLGRDMDSVISVPPGNILEFQVDFYTRNITAQLTHNLLKKGWELNKANMDVLQRYVIQVVEENDIEMILILGIFVNKRITKFYDTYSLNGFIPSAPKNELELDKLINLRTLLQNKDKMRPKLLNVFHYTGAAPIEK